MDRTQIVAGVAGDLNATEQAIDAAIAQATSLVQSMIAGRTALSISPVAGADAQSKAIETIAALASARDAIVACHAELQRDHRRLGFGVYAVGPLNKPKEAVEQAEQAPSHLRVAS